MTRELVLRVKRTSVSVSGCPLLERATLSTLDITCLIHRADVLTNMNLSKDSQTLCACSRSKNVLRLESKVDLSLLALGRKDLRFVTLDLTNLNSLSIFISYGVSGAQRVNVSLCHELCLCHITVIVCGEASRVLALLVSEHSLGPWNIINLVGLLGLSL